MFAEVWGLSSAGRAPALHAGGQRFDPARLHQQLAGEGKKSESSDFSFASGFLVGLIRDER